MPQGFHGYILYKEKNQSANYSFLTYKVAVIIPTLLCSDAGVLFKRGAPDVEQEPLMPSDNLYGGSGKIY